MQKIMNFYFSRKGFSLIELTISSCIVIFLCLGMAQIVSHSLLIKRRSDSRVLSAELASSKLEYFKSLYYESDELKKGTGKEIQYIQSHPEPFYLSWTIQEIPWHLKRIEVECYSENFPQNKAQLILILSRDLRF